MPSGAIGKEGFFLHLGFTRSGEKKHSSSYGKTHHYLRKGIVS